jgi:hypothetical protein
MQPSPRPPRSASASEPESPGEESPSSGLEFQVKELRSDLGDIHASLKRTVRIEWQRLQVRAIDACFRAGYFLCLFAAILAASVTAALLIAIGIREAFVAWSGSAWIGNLGAGAVILGLAIGVGLALRARLRNECVRKAKRETAEEDPPGNGRP